MKIFTPIIGFLRYCIKTFLTISVNNCLFYENDEGVSTTTFDSWLDDWWFDPPRIRLRANNNIQPTALFDDGEHVEFPDYSNISHGSNVEVIAEPAIEEVLYFSETLWQEYMYM